MARCPNCARTVRFWHNYSGYCSRQCRTDSITSCPSCGKVGLYKHERLGCCSEQCRCWYVTSLLGYDKEALVTPACGLALHDETQAEVVLRLTRDVGARVRDAAAGTSSPKP